MTKNKRRSAHPPTDPQFSIILKMTKKTSEKVPKSYFLPLFGIFLAYLGPVKFGIIQKVLSPKGVPRIFDAFLTHFWTFLFPNKTRPILTHFWRISDAFLMHFWRIYAVADAFSKNTFWTIPRNALLSCRGSRCSQRFWHSPIFRSLVFWFSLVFSNQGPYWDIFCPYSLVSAKNSSFGEKMRETCARTFSEAPPNIVCKLCRCTPAQISHNLSTFSDAPAHLSHKFSGTCRECPAHKFCTIFSCTWPGLKICLCTGNECLKPRNVLGASSVLLYGFFWRSSEGQRILGVLGCFPLVFFYPS